MNIWIEEPHFWREARKAFNGEDKLVKDLLFDMQKVNGNGNELDLWLRNRDNRPYEGIGTRNLWHFRINDLQDAARIAFFRVDSKLTGMANGMQKGDYLLMGVIPGWDHELQTQRAKTYIKRFRQLQRISLLSALWKKDRLDAQADNRKKAVNFSSGVFASKCPFKSYKDFTDWLILLSGSEKAFLDKDQVNNLQEKAFLDKDQVEILQKWSREGLRPLLMMGCAGSGKTQLVATALVSMKPPMALRENHDASAPNAYFAISKPLVKATEDLACRIALNCAKCNAGLVNEGSAQDVVSDFLDNHDDLKVDSIVTQLPGEIELFPMRPEFHDANAFLFQWTQHTPKACIRFDKGEFREWYNEFHKWYDENQNGDLYKKNRHLASLYKKNRDLASLLKKNSKKKDSNFEDLSQKEILLLLQEYIRSGDGPSFCDYRLFKFWYENWKALLPPQIGRRFKAVAVWTEIRGLIKGFLGSGIDIATTQWHWGRMSFASGDFDYLVDYHREIYLRNDLQKHESYENLRNQNDAAWRALINADMAKMVNEERVLTNFSEEKITCVKNSIDQQQPPLAEADLIKENIEAIRWAAGFGDYQTSGVFIDSGKTCLSLGEYLQLHDAQTSWSDGDRRTIYNIFLEYEKMKQNLPDENDLARQAAAKLSYGECPRPFYSVFIDECQDFTEMQLLALVLLGQHEGGKFLAGDRHQIISPTYFDPNRVKELFKMLYRNPKQPESLLTESLNKNYRGTSKVVEAANIIAKRRNSVVGTSSANDKDYETAEQLGEKDVLFLYPTEAISLDSYISAMAEDSDVAFIVSDEDKKMHFSKMAGKFGLKAYTIQECKGLERSKIVCIDLIGAYADQWGEINDINAHAAHQDRNEYYQRNARYRYYFNVLYVGATRAQSELIFLESESSSFADCVPWLTNNTQHGLSEDDRKNVRKDANLSFNNGVKSYNDWEAAEDPDLCLERALGFFTEAWRVHTPDCGVDLDRIEKYMALCESNQRLRKGEYIEAALILFDKSLSDEIERSILKAVPESKEQDRVVVSFLAKRSFDGFDGNARKTIVDCLAKDPSGRKALGTVYQDTLAKLTSDANRIAKEFTNLS